MNDEQDNAIWEAISREHSILEEMYNQRIELEKRHERELNSFISKIGKQEVKVQNLCENRVRWYTDSENRVVLDLTEKSTSKKDKVNKCESIERQKC